MMLGTPMSWLINEIISCVLVVVCICHAIKSEQPIHRVLELGCYMLAAGIFENIGVWANAYYYSLDRIMMFGKVPISILFIEGAILYAAMLLVDRIQLPVWARPIVIGLLCSIQDMTLDPSSVYDLHMINGVSEGQWNWTKHYEGGFVGIPFSNFSGWLTMMMYFAIATYIGRYLFSKYQKPWIGVVYPFISTIFTVAMLVSPINQFLLSGVPFVEHGNKTAELALLSINYGVGLMALLGLARFRGATTRSGDSLMFTIPIALHLYALVSSLVLGIEIAIAPVIIVGALHSAYLLYAHRLMANRSLVPALS